jgi:hypothetical protein
MIIAELGVPDPRAEIPMNRVRTLCAVLGAVAAAAWLAAVGGPVAQAAASPGWRLVASHHYPPRADFNALNTVVAPTKTDAWALGGNNIGSAAGTNLPVAQKWNGSTWHAVTLPAGVTGPLWAASAPAANDIWAVTGQTGYLVHFNGSAWSVARTFTSGLFATGVTAFSPTNVWVFGRTGAGPGLGTWHLHGTTWTDVTGLGGSVSTASALSATDIWAIGSVGNNPQNAIVRYQGDGWKRVTSPALPRATFTRILALSPTNVWVSGTKAGTNKPLLVHLHGTTWTAVTVPFKVDLDAMTSDGQGGLWMTAEALSPPDKIWAVHLAVSSTGALTWTRQLLDAGGGFAYDITLIPGTTSLWAVGSKPATTGSNVAIWADGPIG